MADSPEVIRKIEILITANECADGITRLRMKCGAEEKGVASKKMSPFEVAGILMSAAFQQQINKQMESILKGRIVLDDALARVAVSSIEMATDVLKKQKRKPWQFWKKDDAQKPKDSNV